MSEQKKYNRKNVDYIKRVLLVLFLLMCAVPVLFCLYLLLRMNHLERKIDDLTELIESSRVETQLADTSENELAVLDYDAYDDLGKSTAAQNQSLALADDRANVDDDSSDDGSGNASAEEDKEESGTIAKAFSNGKKVYLTFDDGPTTYTDELLDILRDNQVKATFFCVYNPNENVWPAYKRIADEGHTLGMHSYTHVYSSIYANKQAFVDDVTAIHDFLYEQTGVDSVYYRFPGGSSNTVSDANMHELIEYINSMGMTYYDWNALSGDAVDGTLSPQALNETVMKYVRENDGDSIVLLHDLQKYHATIDGLQDLITTLKTEGFEICPIDADTVPIQHVKAVTPEKE